MASGRTGSAPVTSRCAPVPAGFLASDDRDQERSNLRFLRYDPLEDDIAEIDALFFDAECRILGDAEFHLVGFIIRFTDLDYIGEPEFGKNFRCTGKKVAGERGCSDNDDLHRV